MSAPAPDAPRFPRASVATVGVLSVLLFILGLPLRWFRPRGLLPFGVFLVAAALASLALYLSFGAPAWGPRLEARLIRLYTPPRRLRPTREGWWFIAITLLVGGAAINTGNNLLYLLLGMLLSMILASGILSEISLQGIDVSRQPPGHLEAEAPFLMGITLRNGKLRLPSFSVEVEDVIGARPIDKKCYFLKVPAGRTQRTSYRHTFSRRGRYRFEGFRVSTKFPFALFRKSRLVEQPGEVIVYPRLHRVSPPLPAQRGLSGDEARGVRNRRGEYYGLREYRDGDDARDVAWRASAHRGRLVVREHEEEASRKVTLLLDNALPGGDRCADPALLDGLERAVSMAASLCSWFLDQGYAVRLVARGEAVPWAVGRARLDRLLRALALLPTVDEDVRYAVPEGPVAGGGATDRILVARRGARPSGESATVIEA